MRSPAWRANGNRVKALTVRFGRPKLADVALLLLLASLVAPYIHLTPTTTIRIEMLWLPVLLVVALPRIKVPRVAWLLAGYWLWIAIVTCISLARGVEGGLHYASALGYARTVAITVLFYSLGVRPAQLLSALRWFVYLGIPMGLLGVAQAINLGPIVSLTLAAYSGANRGALASQIATFGRLSRATGSFEAPSFAAVYFLLVVGTGLWLLTGQAQRLSHRVRTLLIAGVVSSLIGGVMTLSSTSIAGLAALVLVLLAVGPWSARIRLVATGTVAAALALPLFAFSVSKSPVAAGSLNYQLARLGNLNVFATRFGDQGLLVPTIEAVRRMPLTGWGFISQPGIFLGDSAYVVWLYMGGAVGLLFILGILVLCAYQVRSLGPLGIIVLVWLVVLLASGFGSPSFSIPRIGDWWWALAAMTAAGAKHWRTQ